jgi:hypothetical protein
MDGGREGGGRFGADGEPASRRLMTFGAHLDAGDRRG